MEANPSPFPAHREDPSDDLRPGPGSSRAPAGAHRSPPPPGIRPLGDDADALIRALFACGFTSASVQGRHDVGAEMSLQLTTLIDTLDEAIRGIRHALAAYEAA